jgi:hypothetical protein
MSSYAPLSNFPTLHLADATGILILHMYVGPSIFKYLLVLAGGGVSLVIPVQGTKTQQLLTTRGHDVILFNWNHENATCDCSLNSKNFTVIATVESTREKVGNRWNDGKADAKGRLWAGRVSCWRKNVTSNRRKTFKAKMNIRT